MNEPYTYEMTPSAFQDLDDALHYISIKLHANESALRLLDDIQSAIDRACRYPHAITPVNDELLKARGYRMGLSQGKSTQKCSSRRRKCIFPNLETHSSSSVINRTLRPNNIGRRALFI